MANRTTTEETTTQQKMVELEPGIIVEFGSPEHRAWLGIDAEEDPARRAQLEQMLKAGPPRAMAANKKPIGKAFTKAGEKGYMGFVRRGDGTHER